MNAPFLKDRIETDFSVSHQKTVSGGMTNFHFHDVFEIYLAMTEGVRYFVNDRSYTLKKGDMLVFNNMDLHKSMVGKDVVYERYIVLFDPDYIRELSTPETDLLECFLSRDSGFNYAVHLSKEQLGVFFSLCEKARYYIDNRVFGREIYKKIVLAELLLFVNSLYRAAEMLCAPADENEYGRIRPVIRYICSNLDGELSLDSIAAKFYISKYHLSFLFKKATGFSLNEYIIHYRIMKARELLAKGLPVARTGEAVGYTNLSHFIRMFKKLTGQSPGRYARANKSG